MLCSHRLCDSSGTSADGMLKEQFGESLYQKWNQSVQMSAALKMFFFSFGNINIYEI